MWSALSPFLTTLFSVFRSRAALQVEILALRSRRRKHFLPVSITATTGAQPEHRRGRDCPRKKYAATGVPSRLRPPIATVSRD
jgi:hypothetical protein